MRTPQRPHSHGHSHSHTSGPARRPAIGITPDLGDVRPDLAFFSPLYELKVAYADAVLRAGGLPFVLPYTEDRAVIDAYLDRVSGVVITGGAFDIPAEAYGEQPRQGMGALKPGRTAFETLLLKAALDRHLPVLGICGGMQLLNVVLGGTLHQDIRRDVSQAKDHEQKHDRTQPHHPVDIKEGTHLAECLGRGQLMVNSTHHQAIKDLAKNAIACATSPDGIIEAIEVPGHPFTVGVQWHPELLVQTVPSHLGVYKALVNKARDLRR